MANETVTPDRVNVIDESADRIAECASVLDLAQRAPNWNTEDFESLQRVCSVVYRSLEEIESSLRAVGSHAAAG